MFTVKEVAEKLNVSAQCVYALIDAGKLIAHRIGLGRGTIRVSEDDLQAYLDESRGDSIKTNHLRL